LGGSVEDVELSSFVVEIYSQKSTSRVLASSFIGCQSVVTVITVLLVGNSDPCSKQNDMQIKIGLEIGLIEARNEPVSRVRLKGSIGVLLRW